MRIKIQLGSDRPLNIGFYLCFVEPSIEGYLTSTVKFHDLELCGIFLENAQLLRSKLSHELHLIHVFELLHDWSDEPIGIDHTPIALGVFDLVAFLCRGSESVGERVLHSHEQQRIRDEVNPLHVFQGLVPDQVLTTIRRVGIRDEHFLFREML